MSLLNPSVTAEPPLAVPVPLLPAVPVLPAPPLVDADGIGVASPHANASWLCVSVAAIPVASSNAPMLLMSLITHVLCQVDGALNWLR